MDLLILRNTVRLSLFPWRLQYHIKLYFWPAHQRSIEINQRSTKIAEVRMMKSSNKSTNSQRKSATKDAFVAFLSLLVFALLLGLGSSISSYDFDKQSELSARCRSMGGQTGKDKCYKNGREIWKLPQHPYLTLAVAAACFTLKKTTKYSVYRSPPWSCWDER